jgi:hypothetical protein
MENKEIKINVPDGFEIDKDNSTFELIKFKPVVKEIDKYKSMSDFLFEMFNNTVAKITNEKEITYYKLDGYDPNSDDNQWLFQQDWKNDRLWVRHTLIWQIFEERFGLNYDQIRDFIQDWVKTNLNWKGLTLGDINLSASTLVETNLNWKEFNTQKK